MLKIYIGFAFTSLLTAIFFQYLQLWEIGSATFLLYSLSVVLALYFFIVGATLEAIAKGIAKKLTEPMIARLEGRKRTANPES